MAHKVFISHSERDKAVADAVCQALEAEGIRCWIAPRDVRAGVSWKQSIVEAIRQTRMMVLIFSTESNGSPQVQREVDIAFESGHPILPFRIEDVEMNDGLYYCVAARHWLDAMTEPREEHIEKLVSSVRALVVVEPDAAQIDTHPAVTQPVEEERIKVSEAPPGRTRTQEAPVGSLPITPSGRSKTPAGDTSGLATRFTSRGFKRVAIGVIGVAAFFLWRTLFAGPSAAGITEQGVAAYEAEDYTVALPLLVRAAEKENPEAQYKLGVMYASGQGVEKNPGRALELFQASAAQDHPGGQTGVGYLYGVGEAVPKDEEEAIRWYRMAVAKEFPAAQYNLGLSYRRGTGVPASDEEAVRLWQAAAAQGNASAQHSLANMYANGLAVEKDVEEAARLYQLSADQGNASAQVNLGWMFGRGEGVIRSYTEEVRWYEKAAAQGDSVARNNLEILRNRAWAGAPLVHGVWATLEGEDRLAELERFAADPVSAASDGWDQERVRTLSIDFYPDGALYEVELWLDGERAIFTYLRSGEHAIAIDGTPSQIHALNAEAPLRLETIRQAVSYLQFFIGALQGDDSRFQIVEEPEDLLWLPEATDSDRNAVVGRLRLLDINRDDSGEWQGSGTVAYGPGVYDANFRVDADGNVSMTDDIEIVTDLLIHVEGFDENGLRTRSDGEPEGG